uniref:Sensory neuron membrane protein 2 n=1 Tax=Trichogramma dendrolimi TaxID=114056 RepID=A0A2S0BE02_9HYME|nr:sensory neuron membrane protein 2 [Trichogramma dendrolimi]
MRTNIMALTRMQKIGIAGGCLFFTGILLMTAIMPALVKTFIKQKVALKPGWQMRNLWSKLPFPIYYQFYVFNVTNPEQVAEGEKPIVQEVGPYTYDAWHEKINMIDYEEDDTVSFTIKNTFFYNQQKSGALTGDEEVIVPRYFVLGLVNAILRIKFNVIPFIDDAVQAVFHKPESLFVKAKVKDILFTGMPIDCRQIFSGPGALVCNEIKLKWQEYHMIKYEDDYYGMSLFGWMNATDSKDRLRVRRGSANFMQVGEVVEYNGKEALDVWQDERCDALNGTDGTIFHPFFDQAGRDDLVSFSPGMCRSLACKFDAKTEFAGLKTLRYVGDIGTDPDHNEADRCFCEAPDDCLKKGVYDLYKCVHAPLLVSNPHFYNADPYYLKAVEGLAPSKDKHEMYVDMDPFSGAILNAHLRVQFNMIITKVEQFSLMKNFPAALLPLLWVDENVELPDFLLEEVISGHRLYSIGVATEYIMILIGLGMCGYAGYKYYKAHRSSKLDLKDIKMATNTLDISRRPTIINPTPDFETRVGG